LRGENNLGFMLKMSVYGDGIEVSGVHKYSTVKKAPK